MSRAITIRIDENVFSKINNLANSIEKHVTISDNGPPQAWYVRKVNILNRSEMLIWFA